MNTTRDAWDDQAEARRAKREAFFDTVCLACGEEDVGALIEAKPSNPRLQEYFEEHHVFGRTHDPDTVIAICRNCHARYHLGVPRKVFERAADRWEMVRRMWEAFGSLLIFFGQSMLDMVDWLFGNGDHAPA